MPSRAYRHAADALAGQAQARAWPVQGNFHHLPLYAQFYAPASPRQRRHFCLLGGTLANLEHEPQFLRQGLLHWPWPTPGNTL